MNHSFIWRVEHHESVVSTQDLMRTRLAAGEEVHALVIRADEQRGGRGRRARNWSSPKGGSYQTAALRDPPGYPLKRSCSALVIALAIAEVLRDEGLQVNVKWPNDVLYLGKKLAGILCEYQLEHLLIGVGMNVANPYPAAATGLRGWDLSAVHQLVLDGIARGARMLLDPADLPARFAAVDALAARKVIIDQGDTSWRGVAKGIDASGKLCLETGDGAWLRLAHGHVRWLEP